MTSFDGQKKDIIDETEKPMGKEPVADRSSVTGFFSLYRKERFGSFFFIWMKKENVFKKIKPLILKSLREEGKMRT